MSDINEPTMKIKLLNNTLKNQCVNLLFTFFLMTIHSINSSGNIPQCNQLLNPSTDSIIVKTFSNKKVQEIKLYPDATNEALVFTSTGVYGKEYQLFVFDMDGRLAKLTHVRNKETTSLAQLEKGNYMYEVFSNDDRVENGSITIR